MYWKNTDAFTIVMYSKNCYQQNYIIGWHFFFFFTFLCNHLPVLRCYYRTFLMKSTGVEQPCGSMELKRYNRNYRMSVPQSNCTSRIYLKDDGCSSEYFFSSLMFKWVRYSDSKNLLYRFNFYIYNVVVATRYHHSVCVSSGSFTSRIWVRVTTLLGRLSDSLLTPNYSIGSLPHPNCTK